MSHQGTQGQKMVLINPPPLETNMYFNILTVMTYFA